MEGTPEIFGVDFKCARPVLACDHNRFWCGIKEVLDQDVIYRVNSKLTEITMHALQHGACKI